MLIFGLYPAAIVVLAGLLVCLGIVLFPWRWWNTRRYGAIRTDIYEIARQLQGKVESDGDDVLIAGSRGGRSVFVRFTSTQGEPTIQVRVPIASSLVLFCTPTSYRQPIATDSKLFSDSHAGGTVRIWVAKPTEANLVLTPEVRYELATLCTVSGLLSIEKRECVLTAPELPASPFAGVVVSRADKVVKIAASADSMPDTEPLRPVTGASARGWLRTAETVAILVLAATTLVLGRPPAPKTTTVTVVPSGVPGEAAAHIRGLQGWVLMGRDDFNTDGQAWLQQAGLPVSGELTIPMGPEGTTTRVYALRSVATPGKTRVVILQDDEVVFDADLPGLALMARVPVSEFRNAHWRDRLPPYGPDGDGVVLVMDYQRPQSAIVIFLNGRRTLSMNPVDFRSLQL